MINISISCNEYGCISEITASGHSGQKIRGFDVVCAAVSVLLRTAGELVSREPGVEFTADAGEPGNMFLRIESCRAEKFEWLRGVSEFLITGIEGIQKEFPNNCSFELNDF